MRDIPFHAVYTSDLRRTIETAQLVLRDHPLRDQLSLQMMPEFREVCFGSLEGQNATEVWTNLYKTLQRTFDQNDGRNVIEEMNQIKAMDPDHIGENFMEFWTRVEQGLIKVIDKHRDTNQHILIVSHGMTIRNILHVEYSNGQYHLKALNQTSHFALRKEAVEREFSLLPMTLFEK